AQANGWMQIVLTNDQPEAKDLSLMLRYTTADQGRKCTIRVNGKVLTTYTVPGSVRGADDNGFFNLELPLGDLAFDKNDQLQEKYTVRITADQGTLCPGLYYIRLMRDYEAPESTDYAFRAADWGFSGDANRVSQDKIKVDTEANTITLRQSGSNNICLRYGSEREYDVPLAQKFLVIRGTNLSTTSATAHYLWWLNGSNAGTQVAPSQKMTLADGRVQLVWDITKSGIDANCKSDPWNLTTAYNDYSTLFGLTAKTSTKDVVISYIGFLSEEQLNGTASEPAGDGIESATAGTPRQYYALNGMRLSRPQRGINIVRHTDGRTTKMLN
ncbi:MAG: hypothetical protein HUK02_10590, partial [Bacteroidaceae bacterium]|nr:hypothetical protein [Bacteroidaceae bacterium]